MNMRSDSSLLLSAIFACLILLNTEAVATDTLFNLTDNNGNTVSSNSYKGKVQVIFFGFAQCKDVCPMSLSTIKQTYGTLDSSLRDSVQPIFITVDPERDTVAKVDHFVKHLGDFIGLTGSTENIQATLRTFRVFAMQEIGKSESEYDINHTSLIYVIDKNGQPCTTVASDIAINDMAKIISEIAETKYSCAGFI